MRSSHDMSSSSSSSSAAAAADDVLFAVGFEGEMDRRQITLHLAIKRSRGGRRGREETEERERGEKRLHRQSYNIKAHYSNTSMNIFERKILIRIIEVMHT